MDNKVAVNEFVKRQTKNSGKTYSTLTFNEIAKYAEKQIKLNNYNGGYRDGVIIIETKVVHHSSLERWALNYILTLELWWTTFVSII